MKAKILILIITLVGFSSCIKDYIGHGPKDVKLSSENHLYSGDLFIQYAEEEIANLEALIDKLGQIPIGHPDYDQTQKDIAEAVEEQDTLKIEISNIEDIYLAGSFPRPCPNDPGGKCVPVQLEYFIFPANIVNALVHVQNQNGDNEGVSDELLPLDGYESGLQFIRIPVEFTDSQITVNVIWKDDAGNEIEFGVVRGN